MVTGLLFLLLRQTYSFLKSFQVCIIREYKIYFILIVDNWTICINNYTFCLWTAVSRFILFVISPDWLVDGLRDSIAGVIFCLLIGIVIAMMEIREIEGPRIHECSLLCFGYCLAIPFLFFFTITYLCLGTW